MAIKYSKSRWQKIQAVLDDIIEKPHIEREAKLAELCGDDAELQREVRTLLETEKQGDTLFERPARELASSLLQDEPPSNEFTQLTISQIGPYTLQEELGRGGMGVVYRAERSDGEFEQQVAIKLLSKEAKGTRGSVVVDRFRREKQLLASLVHPNIARLYDGGFTESGQAYIVMEYVAGTYLDEYCGKHALSIDERLRLLLKVIDALSYAHNQLVIHRDIKVSNILVTKDGEIKLLDFGIAKLMDGHQLDDLTSTGEHIMTPGSAAPEQFKNENVTPATDIYQLGLIAYQLLTGKHVFRDRASSLADLVQMVSNEEPTPPSVAIVQPTVFQATEGEDKDVARVQNISQFRHKLKGDLDAIIIKMLRNNPADRYVSMRTLAADIYAYFENRPVVARQQDFAYQTKKFIRRHWRSLSVASGFLLFLLSYAATVTYQAEEIRKALVKTEIEREKAESVSTFLTNVFKAADPNVAGLKTITAQTLLDQGEERILNELNEVPEIQAHMLDLFGEIYFSQGEYVKSEKIFEKLLEEQRNSENTNIGLASALRQVAVTHLYNGKYDSATAMFEESLAVFNNLETDELNDIEYAITLAAYGELKYWQGDNESAVDMLQEAIAILHSLPGRKHEKLAEALNNLANIQHTRGEFKQAIDNMRETIAIQKSVLGENHSYYSIYLNNFAIMLTDMEKFDEADALATEALALQKKILDKSHPYITESLKSLGVLYFRRGDLVSAERHLRQAVQMYDTSTTSMSQAAAFMWLGTVLQALARFDEAEAFYEKMITIFRDLSKSNEIIGRGLGQIASLAFARNDLESAQRYYQEALSIMTDSQMRTTFSQVGFAQVLIELGDFNRAEALLRKAMEVRSHKFPKEHSFVAEVDVLLGVVLQSQGNREQAILLLEGGLSALDQLALFNYGNRLKIKQSGRQALLNEG